ncbi:hypothetical protein [Phyllobacterium myrsinacearum]|uniref:Lipoprotein n=1 Tax=Phyllobacterium myrsinacearum TaxID=28101 RepID=A0A839EG36_9HYPH|nr:hypothetical protein [Phyllobacterium myrsinacearum]MBA8877255.1 hypothetical protein [Phyllobacterium myrsinacearum]
MKFITVATLLSSLALAACGSYASWTPRKTEITATNPIECQRGIGICPEAYGRAGQMRGGNG